ncbi:MAG: rhomboid family intramembrane serine protease [Planctomycetota bacterium]
MILPIGDINPCRSVPVVNYLLLGANVVVFLLFGLAPGDAYGQIVLDWGFRPAALQAGESNAVLTLFTSMFLHGDVWHLAGNMLFLWICGDNVEDTLGSIGYLVFYVACGLAAGLAHMALTKDPNVPCIGASGAISGVLGAYVVFFPHGRIKLLYFINMWWNGVWIVPAIGAIGFWFAEQALLTFLALGAEGSTGVAYGAHVGGFVLGAAAAGLLRGVGLARPAAVEHMERYYERPYRRQERYW